MSEATAKQVLEEALKIDGAFSACLADAKSGMTLGSSGSAGVNIQAEAAGNTEGVCAKTKTMKTLGINDRIEDILITLGEQYHIIRALRGGRAARCLARQRGRLEVRFRP